MSSSDSTWWGSNGVECEGRGTLKQDLSDRDLKLLGLDVKEIVTWRFVRTTCERDNGYNPFSIVYHNEDPLVERILAAQMQKKLKEQNKHGKKPKRRIRNAGRD